MSSVKFIKLAMKDGRDVLLNLDEISSVLAMARGSRITTKSPQHFEVWESVNAVQQMIDEPSQAEKEVAP